jgi:TM2 domain-containing membrane protein YozV
MTVAASGRISMILSKLTFNWFFKNAIARKIEIQVEKMGVMYGSGTRLERVLRLMPSFVRSGAEEYGLNNTVNQNKIDQAVLEYSPKQASQQIAEVLAGPVIQGVLRAVFMILLCFAFFFIYRTMCKVLEDTVKSPAICYCDPIFSGVFGATRAVIYLLIVLCGIGLIFPVINDLGIIIKAREYIDKSYLVKLFYENNILNFIIGDIKNIA